MGAMRTVGFVLVKNVFTEEELRAAKAAGGMCAGDAMPGAADGPAAAAGRAASRGGAGVASSISDSTHTGDEGAGFLSRAE